MPDLERPEINMSSIKVAGVGGLGMVAIIGIMAYALPEVRWFVAAGLGGGIVGGLAFLAYRALRGAPPPHAPVLMGSTSDEPAKEPTKNDVTMKLAAASAR
jgi:hypothetical protein